jgi:hypothetical protein
MKPNLARFLNKTIYVSIPTLFEDGVGRPFRLVDAEFNGLWLQSDELTRLLAPDDGSQLASMCPVVFVPFAQIAGVLIATSAADPLLKKTIAGKPRPAEKMTPPKRTKKR